MKVVVFLLALVLFISGFVIFGYAGHFEGWVAAAVFASGLLPISLAFAIPFHLLEKFD